MKKYFEACEKFDWYYSFSDDHRVWSSGEKKEKELIAEYKNDPIKEKIFNDWQNYVFSGSESNGRGYIKPKLENYYESN